MIPDTLINPDLEVITDLTTTKTYDIRYNIVGKYIDDLEALEQAINKVLNTEKYQYPIYSFDYGVEFQSLIGKDLEYVKIELKRRIEECLLNDSRIQSVDDFEFEFNGDNLNCTFNVVSIYGDIQVNKEVDV